MKIKISQKVVETLGYLNNGLHCNHTVLDLKSMMNYSFYRIAIKVKLKLNVLGIPYEYFLYT